jgi:hypothetical protein
MADTPEPNDRLLASCRSLDREADEITALKAENARLREACEATLLAITDASNGNPHFGDLWNKVSAALNRQPQAGGHDER